MAFSLIFIEILYFEIQVEIWISTMYATKILNSNDFKIVGNDAANHQVSPESGYIPFSTKVNLENDGDLYSACSNLTIVVSVIVLGTIIGKGA